MSKFETLPAPRGFDATGDDLKGNSVIFLFSDVENITEKYAKHQVFGRIVHFSEMRY